MKNKEILESHINISSVSTNLLNDNTFFVISTLSATRLRNKLFKAFNTYNLEVLKTKKAGTFYVIIY